MNILDYFLLIVVLFLILIAMKSAISEKGYCTYCAHKKMCNVSKKESKIHTDRGKCIEK